MSQTKGDNTMQVVRIGLDIAKSSFQVHGADAHGKVVICKQLGRSKVLPYFARLPSCLVGLEACGGAHYWARESNLFESYWSNQWLTLLLAAETLPTLVGDVVEELRARLLELDQRIAEYDRRIEQLAKQNEAARRLMQVEGVGPITAPAVVATIGEMCLPPWA